MDIIKLLEYHEAVIYEIRDTFASSAKVTYGLQCYDPYFVLNAESLYKLKKDYDCFLETGRFSPGEC